MKHYNYSEIPCTMTRKECQEILNVSKSTMLKFIKTGAIKASYIAGKYLITKKDLQEFIENSVYYQNKC